MGVRLIHDWAGSKKHSSACGAIMFVLSFIAACCFQTEAAAPVTLRAHTGWVSALAFRPDGEAFATASADKTVRFWDPANFREQAAIKGHDDYVAAVAY